MFLSMTPYHHQLLFFFQTYFRITLYKPQFVIHLLFDWKLTLRPPDKLSFIIKTVKTPLHNCDTTTTDLSQLINRMKCFAACYHTQIAATLRIALIRRVSPIR
jgi:hypothetical protein